MSYEFPAWCQMETALDSYDQDRQAYLDAEAAKLGKEGEQRLNKFNETADALIKGVQTLTGVDGPVSFVELCREPATSASNPFELLMEHVCITFAWEAMGMLGTARERFTALPFVLRDRHPCANARAFLQRVARCYLFGFDAECVIMCRARLDQEFGDKIISDDQLCEWWNWYVTTEAGKKQKNRRTPYGALWARVAAAEHAGMISATEREAADAVRESGNQGVHETPSRADALDTIKKTIQVLDALEAARKK